MLLSQSDILWHVLAPLLWGACLKEGGGRLAKHAKMPKSTSGFQSYKSQRVAGTGLPYKTTDMRDSG